jgi:hypothetical protein
MGTISRESAKRRSKETSQQKRRNVKISNVIQNKKNFRSDELNVMK